MAATAIATHGGHGRRQEFRQEAANWHCHSWKGQSETSRLGQRSAPWLLPILDLREGKLARTNASVDQDFTGTGGLQ
jgi:hypothetical protein